MVEAEVARPLPASRLEASDAAAGVAARVPLPPPADDAAGRTGGNAGFTAAFDGASGEIPLGL
jgi:hypothetical protein